MFNFMQNFQNPNPQNSQFPSMPTNSAAFFFRKHSASFFSSPNSAYVQQSMDFFRHEPKTQPPNMFMSESQVPPCSAQVGIEKEESRPVKKIISRAIFKG